MDNSLEVRSLQLRRPGFVLGPCSLAAPSGGRLAVIGPSGSGKTTLLRCIAGLERPDQGSIRIGGRQVFGDGQSLDPSLRKVGCVFQDGALWPHMTAEQHLRFAAPDMDQQTAQRLLERAGIGALARRKPGAMSGGEAQRLALLRSLAAQPQLLLLDEPLRSVDVHQRDALVLLLRELCDERGLTTVLVSHDRDEALALATDLVVLREGRIVESGPAAQLLAQPRTAFTAAFLCGAACLPVAPLGDGRCQTPFGPAAAAGRPEDLRLVLMPGAVEATPPTSGGVRGRVLVPPMGPHAHARIALGEQILLARAPLGIRPGSEVELRLDTPPCILPWDGHLDA